MKYTVAAILALAVAPAYSLSYLESLNRAAPAVRSAAPAPAAEPPFFFTNGAKDEPAGTPDFFFTNGSASAPVTAATTSSGYLSALTGGGNSVSGAGMRSYLDSLPKNAPPSTGGAGLQSYTDNLSGGAAAARPAFTPPPAAPAASSASSQPAAPAMSGLNYMEMLAKHSISTAPTGTGLTSYLDVLPRAPATRGGAGIQSYTDNLPVTNTVAGTGAGMATYTDNLSGGRTSSGKAYTPFASKPAAKGGATGGASTGRFEFTINADADMIAQLKAAGDRRVRLSGRATLN